MQNNIRFHRKKAGLSQTQLAGAAGTVKSKISTLESGKQELTLTWMEKICDALASHGYKIEPADLLPNSEIKKLGYINVIGEVQAGIWSEASQWDEADWQVALFDVSEAEKLAYGLRVKGDSMDEFYPEGSIVVVMDIHDYPIPIDTFDHVIVQRCRGGDICETTIKELVIKGDKAELWPRSRNPKYKDPICLFWPYDKRQQHGIESVEIKGVVIGSINRRKRF